MKLRSHQPVNQANYWASVRANRLNKKKLNRSRNRIARASRRRNK